MVLNYDKRYCLLLNQIFTIKLITMEGKGGRRREETKGKGPDNEIRVTGTTYIRTYLAYIARLFDEKHEEIIIRGMGQVIPKAVALSMLVRKRFKGLHQVLKIETEEFNERGFVRRVGLVKIVLSKKQLDKNDIGYSAPLPDSEVTEYKPFVPGEQHEEGRREGGPPRSRRGNGGRLGGRGLRGGF